MPSTAPWARYDPRIRLVVDGQEMPCVRCNVDYELNAIPQASATLAVGRDFKNQPSPVHTLIENFVNRAPCQIYITPNALGQSGSSAMQGGDLGLSGDEVRIFDGFVTAAGFSRSRGNAQFTIQMEHWLSEMAFSSVFSKSSHPSNIGDFSYGAISPVDDSGANFYSYSLADKYVNGSTIESDFWGDAVKQFLTKLCNRDNFFARVPGGAVEPGGKNDQALAALNRFGGPYQQKLGLDLKTDADITNSIRIQVASSVSHASQIAHQTLWDMLIGMFCSQFLFSIVPRVEDAIAAPFMAGYREQYLTITTNEETQVEWMRGLGRPLRAVGIMAFASASTGALKSGQGAPPAVGVGGYFEPDPDSKGVIIVKQGPDWTARLYSPSLYASASAGAKGNAIGTAVQPGGPKVNDVPGDVKKRLTDAINPFLKKYAQAHYALEKLRTRQAVCSGPFRLDIAPGSVLKIENEAEQHIGGDAFAAPFYAHVARVSIAVDGEQPMIGTSFHLSHIRSEKENGDDKTSIKAHPLYKETFKGCPLVDIK
jgi:hypothetical protein